MDKLRTPRVGQETVEVTQHPKRPLTLDRHGSVAIHGFRIKHSGAETGILRLILAIGLLAIIGLAWIVRSLAQSGEIAWTEPVNITKSGAASLPSVAIASDGTMRALWWDTVEGEQYARTVSVTDTSWLKPVTLPQIVGDRKEDQQTGKAIITPPRQVYLKSTIGGSLYAFWFDVNNQLSVARNLNDGWSVTAALADAVVSMNVVNDISDTLHLVYLQTIDQPNSPAGIYYRVRNDAGWAEPTLVYSSTYFRTSTLEGTHLSLAGDSSGRWIVVWNEARLGSGYARSTDGGATWSTASAIQGSQGGQVTQPMVGLAPDGGFLLVWRDASAGGCGLTQRRSNDSGETWTAPEFILTDLPSCPNHLAFLTGGEGRLWLTGMPTALDTNNPGTTGGVADSTDLYTGLLAAWDGRNWSLPVDVSLNAGVSAQSNGDALGCLIPAFGTNSVALLGCDTRGDFWVAHNNAPIEQLIQVAKPAWSAPELLSQDSATSGQTAIIATESLPALTADGQGKLYTMWSQATGTSGPGVALYCAVWSNGRWSRGSRVWQSPAQVSASPGAGKSIVKAEQPSLSVGSTGHLNAVWSGGTNGQIFYSWALLRDAISGQGWATPVALPMVSQSGEWPDIVADPRGNTLYVLYAVPYNEKRGIWLTRSDDGGATWSQPDMVFDAVGAGWSGAGKARLALDAKLNILHAIWLQADLPGGTASIGLYYSRSSDGGHTWSAAVRVADGVEGLPQVVVPTSSQVYLLWQRARSRIQANRTTPYEAWGQFSPDAGMNWGDATRIPGLEQVSGPVGLVTDGAGRLYLTAFGAGDNGTSELLFSQWNGQDWTDPETYAMGQPAIEGNSLASALASAASGSRLELVMQQWRVAADGSNQYVIAAAGRDITSSLQIVVAPTFTPMPNETAVPTNTPLPLPTRVPVLPARSEPAETLNLGPLSQGLALILAAAVGLVVAVVGIILASVRKRSGKYY